MSTTLKYNGISNPSATCGSAAVWHIKAAQEFEESFYPRMAARLFSIFMMEGVINALGQILYESWPEKKEKEGLLEKHRMVRVKLGLTNTSKDYNQIFSTIKALIDFRNELAHPKIASVTKEIPSAALNRIGLPAITHWEEMMERHTEENEFKQIEEYLRELLKVAQIWIEKNVPYEKRSHFPDVRGLMVIPGMYSASTV